VSLATVNADDFGYSGSVNQGILEAFDRGLITSTSVMATMAAFEEACALARDAGFERRIGAHVVLDEGEPLTDPMKRSRTFCDKSGRFLPWRFSGLVRLDRDTRRAVHDEVLAQVGRCHAHGIAVTHLDSHHHCHVEPCVGGIFIRIARELGLTVRLSRNVGPPPSMLRHTYKRLFNLRLRRAGLARTRYFGQVEDYVYAFHIGHRLDFSRAEVLVHPVLDESGILVDTTSPDRTFESVVSKLPG
jgi:predicted glycoside hydrolase/deacetylase ChbG (UPF0249 family)